jgi:hypothetical protein
MWAELRAAIRKLNDLMRIVALMQDTITSLEEQLKNARGL